MRWQTLVGEWQLQASVNGRATARGRAAFTWLEDGAFLMLRVNAEPVPDAPKEWKTNSPFPLVTVIGLDDPSGLFCYAYADARGVRRVYQMKLAEGVWELWGRAGPEFFQRFTGTFEEGGDRITGHWDRSRDGTQWERDFDIVYTRIR